MHALDWNFEVSPLTERSFGIVRDDELVVLQLGWLDIGFYRPDSFNRFRDPLTPLSLPVALGALADWLGIPRSPYLRRWAAAGAASIVTAAALNAGLAAAGVLG